MEKKFSKGEWSVGEVNPNKSEISIWCDHKETNAIAGYNSLIGFVSTADVDTDEEAIANAKLISAAPDLLEALIAISTNKHLNLGDLIYDVRERELKGWEGESVKAWSDAVKKVEAAIKKATQ